MKDTFPLLTLADLENMPDPEWLLDGVLPDEGLGVLFGESGAAKSFLALDWALSTAAGVPWLDREIRRAGHVVYVAGEGRRGMGIRTRAWLGRRCPAAAARDRLGERFHLLPDALNLLDPAMVDKTRRTLASLAEPPTLLVVDTVARSMVEGDENSAQDMGRFIAALDSLLPGALRLVVHHTGIEPGRERGSTALRAAADARLEVRRDTGRRVILSCKKQKDGEEFEDVALRIEMEGSSCVLVEAGPCGSAKTSQPEAESHAALVLALLAGEKGPLSKNAINRAVTGQKETILKAVDALAAEGKISKVEGGWIRLPESSERLVSPSGSRDAPKPVPMRSEPVGTTPSEAPSAGGSPTGPPRRGVPPGTASSSNGPNGPVCHCRRPARSPRANGPDECVSCRKLIRASEEAA